MMKIFIFLLLFAAIPSHAADLIQSRALQNLWVRSGFQIGVDSAPAWTWYGVSERHYEVFVIESPEQYYPPAVINIRFNKYHPPQSPDKFKKSAYYILLNMQKKLGAKEAFRSRDLVPVTYGELKGFEQTSIIYLNNEPFSNKVFVGLNAQSKLIVLNALTLPGKVNHLQITLDRMWGSINFLNSSIQTDEDSAI
jgi:hypothetical protein